MNRYDWSKLDAGWRFEPRSASVRTDALVHTTERDTDRHFAIAELEQGIGPTGMHTNYWRMLWPFAIDQLAKCRIRDTELAPYPAKTPLPEHPHFGCIATPGAKPRVINPPVREYLAIPGIPPEWMEPPPQKWEEKAFDLPEDLVVLGYQPPPPPWRRGPLVAWTLVNISCHDGRLTVVMKRGRGELVMETGPDDEVLWERLGKKVVDIDKAKGAEEAKPATK